MTINKKFLREWEESMHVLLSKPQKTAILARFSTEPEPYTWSEQDIYEQIRCFIVNGCFVKPVKNSGIESPPMPPGINF